MKKTKSKKVQGELYFNAHNYMLFVAEDQDDPDGEGPSICLDWWVKPKQMAKHMRKVADWLDEHSTENINVEID